MAGTDRSLPSPLNGSPIVILVQPQLGENIGTVARAMMNCGLSTLRLVKPRDGWPSEKAIAAASGADAILDAAALYDTTTEAVADLHRVYAATARRRDMVKPVATPKAAVETMGPAIAQGQRCGILFGRERSGLDNDDVVQADTILHMPLNPAFMSLNLAQAVLLVGYEWWLGFGQALAGEGAQAPALDLPTGAAQPAHKSDLEGFFHHLETELDRAGFLFPPEKRPRMVRNIRNMFQRANLTDQEVRTLRGMLFSLVNPRPASPEDSQG